MFAARARLIIWKLDATGIRAGPPIVDATSSSAAAEVGGGPWWDSWSQKAKMNPAVAATMRTPFEPAAAQLAKLIPFGIPESLKPPGY